MNKILSNDSKRQRGKKGHQGTDLTDRQNFLNFSPSKFFRLVYACVERILIHGFALLIVLWQRRRRNQMDKISIYCYRWLIIE